MNGRLLGLLVSTTTAMLGMPASTARAADSLDAPAAQASDSPLDMSEKETSPRIGLTLAYFGQTFTHPGALASVQYRLLGSGLPHQLFARASLGGYLHPRNHAALMVTAELGYRATASFGLCGEVAGGIGYLHTFLASPLYEVGDDGRIFEATDAGRPGFAPGASVGLGWDLGRSGLPPLTIMLRPHVWWQVPYNATVALRFGASLGVTYSF